MSDPSDVPSAQPAGSASIDEVPVTIGRVDREPLDNGSFSRMLIGKLAQTLQDVVGIEESAGFVAIVGQLMGTQINDAYRSALGTDRLERGQIPDVLVDVKRRIGGEFSIESADAERVVLTNSRCPFGERVIGRPALCMMTSNVFGSIAAENLGYAKVRIDQAIATGDSHCRVVVWTRPSDAALADTGREYFSAPEDTTAHPEST